MIQTMNDIIKAHEGFPIAIGIKVETKVDEGNPDKVGKGECLPAVQAGTAFIIELPIK